MPPARTVHPLVIELHDVQTSINGQLHALHWRSCRMAPDMTTSTLVVTQELGTVADCRQAPMHIAGPFRHSHRGQQKTTPGDC
eukprot:3198874-Amphidinium_carterae.1